MTNEEAIAIISNEYKCVDRDCDIERSCGKCDLMIPNKEPILEAYKLAIKALEQQQSDTVSRGAFEQVMWERGVAIGQLKELGYELGQKIEPCEDAISGQAVCNIVNDIRDCISVEGYCAIIERLKKLPPVTPKSETVTEFADRCRECGKMRKGHWIWNFDKGYCKCSECGIGMGHKEFDYCPNCGAKMESEE